MNSALRLKGGPLKWFPPWRLCVIMPSVTESASQNHLAPRHNGAKVDTRSDSKALRRSFVFGRVKKWEGRRAYSPAWLKPATLALLLVFWQIALQPAVCRTVEEQVAEHFRVAQEALRQGELTRATEEFKKVLALDPELVEARINLGLVYHALGEFNLAATNLSAALQQKPNLAGPATILGIDYLKLGEGEKGIPVLQRALRLEPSNLEGHRALARCYLSVGDFRHAANEYGQLASLNPDKANAWYNLGHDYVDLAARLAFRGAEVYRGSPWGNRFLGDMLFQRNRWQDAAEEYMHALAVDPKQPGLHASFA